MKVLGNKREIEQTEISKIEEVRNVVGTLGKQKAQGENAIF